MLKIYEGKVYERVETALFTIDKPVKAFNFPPMAKWKGKRIQQHLWKQVQSFFLWSYQKHGSEAVIRMYYNEKLGLWKFHAYPQRAVGLKVDENEDRDEMQKQRLEYVGDDYVLAGTVHHHCGSKAFQSGVDKDDENAQTGLHITLGDLDESRWSIHARVRHSATYYVAMLSDWFDGPKWMKRTPQRYWEEMVEDYLTENSDSTVTFPNIWQENYTWIKGSEKRSAVEKAGYGLIVHGKTVTTYAGSPREDNDGKPINERTYPEETPAVNIDAHDRFDLITRVAKKELERRRESIKVLTPEELEKRQRLETLVSGEQSASDEEATRSARIQPDLFETPGDRSELLRQIDKVMLLYDVSLKELEEYQAITVFAGKAEPA